MLKKQEKEILFPLTEYILEHSDRKVNDEIATGFIDSVNQQNSLLSYQWNYPKESYTRESILPDKTAPYEIVISKWCKNAFTPVHGHPQLALYYVIQGKFRMELYHCHDSDDDVTFDKELILEKNQFFYHIGDDNRYDNFIHRVFADDNSIAIHLFSEPAVLGKKFSV